VTNGVFGGGTAHAAGSGRLETNAQRTTGQPRSGPPRDETRRRGSTSWVCSGGFQGSSLHERVAEGSEESLGGLPFEGLAWSAVELVGDREEVAGGVDAEVRALREVVAQKPVGVLVAGSFPRLAGVAEVDRRPRCLGDRVVVGDLRALVPGE